MKNEMNRMNLVEAAELESATPCLQSIGVAGSMSLTTGRNLNQTTLFGRFNGICPQVSVWGQEGQR